MSTSVRITVHQYDEMIAQGVFEPREDHHVELLEGEIVPMSPMNPPHDDATELLTDWSYQVFPRDQVRIRVQASLGLTELASVPEPDLFWARRRSYRRRRPEPGDILLLIEVADSSLRTDRGQKSRLYAEAGIADYWIVNVPGRCIEVRRQPQGNTYQSIRTYSPGESIPLLAFPEIVLPVATVFPEDDDDELP